MLWPRKLPPDELPARRQALAPAALPVTFEPRLFEQHFGALVAAAERLGGVEAWLDALGEKQRRMTLALNESAHARLFDLVFGARRKLGPMANDAWVGEALGRLR